LETIPLLTVESHDEGRNAIVSVYADRIERVKERSRMSIRRASQDAETIPLRQIASVETKKDGMRYTQVVVVTAGNRITFRCKHDEAKQLKDELTRLVLDREN